ncbi:MAG TPA: D-alanyl-D-alanine carboxypeptidase/D-alanyl-D-alanine-endopeptidase, partial [Terriglobales bacterium]|nr:D-alanyl-D-alanine carboxypeptidase/D-alanyl-D-alanine-endopeptidase [Terriglobales bacterium]
MRRNLISLAFIIIALASLAQARDKDRNAPDKELAKKIEAILARPELAPTQWGIDVVSLADHRTLYALNEEKLFIPASNCKLITTAATLAMIGPDYRFHTTVETTGQLDGRGRIIGDVSLVGRGDPNLSGRDLPYNIKTERSRPALWVLDDLADQLVKDGVKFIEGDVIGDDSFYPNDRFPEGWAQDDLQWYYGAPISALTLNDNVITVNIQPSDHQFQRAFIAMDPFTDFYDIENKLTTSAAGTPRSVAIRREVGSRSIEFWGSIPLGDTGDEEELAIEDPAQFAAEQFRSALERHGIMVYGKARAHHLDVSAIPPAGLPSALTTPISSTPEAAAAAQQPSASASAAGTPNVIAKMMPRVLATHDSLPLIEDLRLINKVSQNLHAEMALRLLAHERGGIGTTVAGLEVEKQFLTQAGIAPQEYVLYDGSGLSRQDLV